MSNTQNRPTTPFNPGVTYSSSNWNTEAGGPQIEAKNLGIVQDQMYHEALAYKKCCLFAEWLTDQPVKDVAIRAAQHHKQHFNALYDYLHNHQ